MCWFRRPPTGVQVQGSEAPSRQASSERARRRAECRLDISSLSGSAMLTFGSAQSSLRPPVSSPFFVAVSTSALSVSHTQPSRHLSLSRVAVAEKEFNELNRYYELLWRAICLLARSARTGLCWRDMTICSREVASSLPSAATRRRGRLTTTSSSSAARSASATPPSMTAGSA